MTNTTWYHGGDFKNGKPKGTYIFLTDNPKLASAHVQKSKQKQPDRRVYRLRPEFAHLVMDHPDGTSGKVIRQDVVRQHGGALSVFQEID